MSAFLPPEELLRRATTEAERVAAELQAQLSPALHPREYLEELSRRLGAIVVRSGQ